MRPEHKIRAGSCPFQRTAVTVAPFKDVSRIRYRRPLRAHIKKVGEEVVGQCLWCVGEHSVLCAACIDVQHTQTTDQNGHFRGRQRQKLRPVDQQFLRGNRIGRLEIIAETVCRRLQYRKTLDIGLFL